MPLRETASDGNRLTTLRALRDDLAGWLDDCESARDQAALSQRLVDVLSQIDVAEKAEPEQKGTVLDELNARRASRNTGTARQA